MEKLKTAILEKSEPLINKVAALTTIQRFLLYGGLFFLIAGAYAYFVYLPKQQEISTLAEKKAMLSKQLLSAKKKASSLEKFRKKMDEAKIQFEIVKRTLPEKKDIPSLLTSISQSGRDAGLDFFLFQPKGEANKGFYAEIPVAIQVKGNYHNLALFFAKVANLSRIVNIKNISITGGKELSTTCTAITYRFVDDSGKKTQTSNKKKRKPRK